MSRLKYTLSANKPITLPRGNFIKIDVAPYPVNLNIINSNGNSELFNGVVSGEWFELDEQFSSIHVTSPYSGEFTFTVLNGKTGNDNYSFGAGKVERFSLYAYTPTAGATYHSHQVYNPVGSGIILGITRWAHVGTGSVKSGILTDIDASDTNKAKNIIHTNRDSLCEIKSADNAAQILPSAAYENFSFSPAGTFTAGIVSPESPVIVDEGYGFVVECTTTTAAIMGKCEFFEIGK